MSQASGRILIRMKGSLHQQLLDEAQRQNKSLNDLCLERLEAPSTLEGHTLSFLRALVIKADLLLEQDLVGVVLYGSQARGESHTDSDWDILIVTKPQLNLSRDLYRRWDKLSSDIAAEIEVHFAQIPPQTSVATGFWGEIALDGIVLYEKSFAISQHLGRVRRDIAQGVIVRKTSHGQSYWVHREAA